MKLISAILVALVLLSCAQPSSPVMQSTAATVPVIITLVKVIGPEYDAFLGNFIHTDSRGFKVLVSFLGKDKCMAVCITANATVYLDYTFVLDKDTITTYNGTYPIIWWFECINYPYRWDDADTLIVTDPVNNRVLTLRRR